LKAEQLKAKNEADELEAIRQAEIAQERAKQAELKAQLEAKERAEKEAIEKAKEAERLAKLEAEKLAKAPIKKQMQEWVNSFEIPQTNIQNDQVKEIQEKFEAFKIWSNKVANSL
jgi:hypothetical protein